MKQGKTETLHAYLTATPWRSREEAIYQPALVLRPSEGLLWLRQRGKPRTLKKRGPIQKKSRTGGAFRGKLHAYGPSSGTGNAVVSLMPA